MFKLTITKVTVVTATAALSLGVFKVNPAQAAGFSFSQTGFTGGGTLSGMFSGDDTDNNEVINLTELTSWMLSFTGDSAVDDISHNSLSNLVNFAYSIPGNFLAFLASGDDLNDPNTAGAISIFAGLGGATIAFNDASVLVDLDIGMCVSNEDCSVSSALISVTPKPIPEPLTMLGVGTAVGFGSFFKRKLAEKKDKESV